MLSYQNIFLA